MIKTRLRDLWTVRRSLTKVTFRSTLVLEFPLPENPKFPTITAGSSTGVVRSETLPVCENMNGVGITFKQLESHLRDSMPIPIVSFFCGPGGMDLGFRQEGFETVLAIDNNQAAVDTYNWNTPGLAIKKDISKISDEEIVQLVKAAAPNANLRGVIGGPPCQSFSVGNVCKKNWDPRAKLGQEYARLLKALNAEFNLDFFAFENVLGLNSPKHRRRKNLIFRALEDAGFKLFEYELDASDFGVPQKRCRLFIVGVNKKKFLKHTVGTPSATVSAPVTVRQALEQLPAPIFFRNDIKPEEIPLHPNHWAMNPRSAKFKTGQGFNGRSFRKLDWDRPSWTVAYGNREVHVHPTGTRRLSVYEAMILQGFPTDYELRGTLSEQITQISDAVPPPLSAAVARQIKATIAAQENPLLVKKKA